MKSHLRGKIVLSLALLTVAAGVARAWQTETRLLWNGKVLSNDVQTIKGRAYVPIRDLAKGLDASLSLSDGEYRLIDSSKANPIAAPAGKMTTDLFSGRWRFQVASVQQVAEYPPQYGSDKTPLVPKESGDILTLVHCHLKNGAGEKQEVSFDLYSGGNTALSDAQGRGYIPLAYDSRNSGYSSNVMPPGSTHDFVIIFSVPKDATLKELNYTIGASGWETRTMFRVSLKP